MNYRHILLISFLYYHISSIIILMVAFIFTNWFCLRDKFSSVFIHNHMPSDVLPEFLQASYHVPDELVLSTPVYLHPMDSVL